MNSYKPEDLFDIRGKQTWTRRQLLQQASFSTLIMPLAFQQGWGRRKSRVPRVVDPARIPLYRFKTLPVHHFTALQKEFDAARDNSRLGRDKTYLKEIAPLGFRLSSDFPNAKSVIVVATYAKNMYANFQLDGRTHRILVPFHYYNDGMNGDALKDIVLKEVIKTSGRRLVDISSRTPLKLLAARSGLGRYARNSLVFVDGMGSYNLLHAFLTDHEFSE
ncbi:MAG TPA: hypothetical protein VLL97_13885, partial [Acidobacteriota bacterium]|nr:hypothetical protein [Acidobacteriota bacterium]